MDMIITDNYILLTFKLKKEIQIIRIYLQGHKTQAAGLKEKKIVNFTIFSKKFYELYREYKFLTYGLLYVQQSSEREKVLFME